MKLKDQDQPTSALILPTNVLIRLLKEWIIRRLQPMRTSRGDWVPQTKRALKLINSRHFHFNWKMLPQMMANRTRSQKAAHKILQIKVIVKSSRWMLKFPWARELKTRKPLNTRQGTNLVPTINNMNNSQPLLEAKLAFSSRFRILIWIQISSTMTTL